MRSIEEILAALPEEHAKLEAKSPSMFAKEQVLAAARCEIVRLYKLEYLPMPKSLTYLDAGRFILLCDIAAPEVRDFQQGPYGVKDVKYRPMRITAYPQELDLVLTHEAALDFCASLNHGRRLRLEAQRER